MNLLNNIFGISQRSIGHIEDGKVIIDKIDSYDMVADPAFSNAIIDWSDTLNTLKRIQERKDKIKKLKNV